MDKNQAVLDFIGTYEGISTSPIFVNFMNAKDKDIQFLTSSNDTTLNRKFIDGSVMKQYTFSIVITRSITDIALIQALESGESNENIADLAEIQAFMDWINEQGENQFFPNFGTGYTVESMKTENTDPRLNGVDTSVNPPLAQYSIAVTVTYLDETKMVWSTN